MPRVAIVIPMYGKEEYTRKCLELTKKNYGTGEPIEIVVVDDGSKVPFVDPTVNVVRLEENSGFTAAANAGILWAQYRNCDYVLLLNNDTEPYLGFLQELVTAMELDEKIGIAASVRIHEGDVLKAELYGADLIRGYQMFIDEKDLPNIPLNTTWIPLASGLLRMSMVREIGILDKRFRNHCSDSEYCIRAKLNGWNVALVPTSRVKHHRSVTTSANNINVGNDQNKFIAKLAGMDVAQLMKEMPLDCESKSYGELIFNVVKR